VVTDLQTNKLTNKDTHKQSRPITIHSAAYLSGNKTFVVGVIL